MYPNSSIIAMMYGAATNVASSRSVSAVSESDRIARVTRREVSSLATVAELNRVQFEMTCECEPAGRVGSNEQPAARVMELQWLGWVLPP